MAKYIKREEVIEITAETGALETQTRVMGLPSIDIVHYKADRATGEWVDIGGVIRYGCPFCHHAQKEKSNFCPNCGADMRGEA